MNRRNIIVHDNELKSFDLNLCWRKVRYRLKSVYGPTVDAHYFSHLRPSIRKPSTIFFQPLDKEGTIRYQHNYLPKIKELMMQEIPPGFQIDLNQTDVSKNNPSIPTSKTKLSAKEINSSIDQVLLDNFKPNPLWTFSTFVENETNSLAMYKCIKMSKGVIDGSGTSDKLILIQADVGQGKSHLLHACASAWKHKNPDKSCRLMSAATFTHNFVQALQSNKNGLKFHKEIRSLDALFFDDLHFVTGKRATCQALFEGIEVLRTKGIPVVITTRSPISDLTGLEQWMKSRLQEGLISIKPANKLLRQTLVDNSCNSRKINLTKEMKTMLVTELPGSPRELNGALSRIADYCELNSNTIINTDKMRLLLMDFFSGRSSVPHVDAIKSMVSSYFGVTTEELSIASRRRRLTQPRQVAMYFCKRLTPRSLPEIGRLFGNRDHSTVIHAVQVVEKRKKTEPFFSEELLGLERQIKERPV